MHSYAYGSEAECCDLPGKPERIDNAIDGLLEHLSTRCYLMLFCESPIEVDLGCALLELASHQFELWPQYRLGRYRYDFALLRHGANVPTVLIECDGAEFHHTPEQLANDAAKDKAALEVGTVVVRLTGKEIYRDPKNAARIVLWQCDGRP